jgi:hypothetical protein
MKPEYLEKVIQKQIDLMHDRDIWKKTERYGFASRRKSSAEGPDFASAHALSISPRVERRGPQDLANRRM